MTLQQLWLASAMSCLCCTLRLQDLLIIDFSFRHLLFDIIQICLDARGLSIHSFFIICFCCSFSLEILCACDHPSLSWVWTHSSGYLFAILESQRQLENVSAHRHDMTGSIPHGPPHLDAWAAIHISFFSICASLFSPTCLLYCGVYGFLLTWGCWVLGILKAACFGVTVKISLSFAWYIEG